MTPETHKNGNGNGHLGVVDSPHDDDSIFLDDAPEVVASEDTEVRGAEIVRDEGDIVDAVETERGSQPSGGRGRKLAVGAVFVLLLLGVGGASLYFMFGSGATKKARVQVNGATQQQSDDALTQHAIDQIKTPGITLSDGTVVQPQVSASPEQSQVISDPVTQFPGNPNLSATVQPSPSAGVQTAGEGQSSSSSVAKLVASDRNNERSVQIGERVTTQRDVVRGDGGNGSDRAGVTGVVVPSFGSMLPVRSLGAIYTLRSGGLVRFELTRDVKGRGWSLPHGTVLVGALRGSEYDRAFISLVGFIDNESGKFVKVTGDVLGSDGGAGVRGKRRKMSSSWSRVLSKLGEAGLNIAGGVASSIGRRPVIISDAFGSAGYRVTNEFNGVLTNRDRNTFVEVAAGTSCYMMITELPDSIQGVDALSKFSGREVESRADSDQPRQTTGISERELAALMESGEPEQIKAAMPRMTPEMRRVAEAVIAQNGDR